MKIQGYAPWLKSMFNALYFLLHIYYAFHSSPGAVMNMRLPFPLATYDTPCLTVSDLHFRPAGIRILVHKSPTSTQLYCPVAYSRIEEPLFSVPDGVQFSCSVASRGPRGSSAVEESDGKYGLSVGEIL